MEICGLITAGFASQLTAQASSKMEAQESNKARKLTKVRAKKTNLVKIVVEYVVNSVEILGKDVESLTNRCEIEESHRGAHHRCEG